MDAALVVKKIKSVAHDPELAHALECRLRADFIECLANGMYDLDKAIGLAQIVLSTRDIPLERLFY